MSNSIANKTEAMAASHEGAANRAPNAVRPDCIVVDDHALHSPSIFLILYFFRTSPDFFGNNPDRESLIVALVLLKNPPVDVFGDDGTNVTVCHANLPGDLGDGKLLLSQDSVDSFSRGCCSDGGPFLSRGLDPR